MGQRISLADLADTPMPDTPLPSFATGPKTSLPVGDIAPNPCNQRETFDIEELAQSLKTIGQSTPCAVVTVKAFLAVFPEHADAVDGRPYVAVTGRRRQLAAERAGIPLLEVTIKDEFAESRSRFLALTASENLDRKSLDPIEEARTVQDLVTECGTATVAAVQLSRSEGWVSQRLILLQLVPSLQRLVSARKMPIRVGREIGKLDPDEQEKAWADHQASQAEPPESDPSGNAEKADKPDKPGAKPRTPAVQVAIRRLGTTPDKIAASLLRHLSAEDVRELVRFLGQTE